jgi:ATPase subunit of ABC transporter with duplicated ATPase domains
MSQGLRLAYVAQDPALNGGATMFDAVAQGLSTVRDWIDAYGAGQGDLAPCRRASRPRTAGTGSSAWPRPCSACGRPRRR